MAAAGGARARTSFQRRPGAAPRPPALPGTRPALRHGQLLLSSGLPSLDGVLGGGVAVGTLLLIEEDKYGLYSNLLFKYFLAEGIVCGHDLFVASAKEHPDNILKELPAPLLDDTHGKELGDEAVKPEDFQDSMKIAWRYQNLPKMEASPTPHTKFGHYYDISKKMSPELCQSVKWHSFYLHEELSAEAGVRAWNMNSGYARLLQSIQRIISQEGFDGSDPQKKQRNVLRIGIQSLGSPLWGDDVCCSDAPEDPHSLTKFLYALRGLLRKSLSACIITVPAHLVQNKAIMERVTNLSDMVVGLESFIGSERETNPLYKDYHGLVHVHQIPRLNSLICDVSDTKDLAFRLKRKQFAIEVYIVPEPYCHALKSRALSERNERRRIFHIHVHPCCQAPAMTSNTPKFQMLYYDFGKSRLSVNISSLLKILMVLDEHKFVRKPQMYGFFKFLTSTKIVSYYFSDLFILLVHKKYYLLLIC